MGSSLMAGRTGENDKGFWEQEEIVVTHERLLKEMGYSWDDPGLLPDRWWETGHSQKYIDEICRVIEADIGSASFWALKDPRMCRLLPLWQQVFARLGVKPLYLHIFRNPLEVAASLQHRDEIPRPLALLLWFQHNLEAVQNSAGSPRRFLTFPQLLDHGESRLLHIFQEWELSAYVKGVTDDPDESPFLNSLLRHHQVPDSELMTDQDVPHLVKDLYQILLEAAASGKEPASEKLDHIVQQYQQATSLLMPWTGLSDQLRALLEKRDARIAELAPALKDAQHYVRARERDIEELNRQIEALGETIKTLQMNSN
jgi:hypothetical protein